MPPTPSGTTARGNVVLVKELEVQWMFTIERPFKYGDSFTENCHSLLIIEANNNNNNNTLKGEATESAVHLNGRGVFLLLHHKCHKIYIWTRKQELTKRIKPESLVSTIHTSNLKFCRIMGDREGNLTHVEGILHSGHSRSYICSVF